jgi:predicted RNA-binding protein
MCQATVYLNDEKLMEDVIYIHLTPGQVRLSTLFEPPRTVQASLREIDLLKHRVWLETVSETREEK